MATSALGRQFRDVFPQIATGHSVSAGTAITSGTQQTLAVSIPNVDLSGLWAILAIIPASTLGGCTLAAELTAAGVVTVYIQNLTGGSVTPAAQEITVVAAKIDKRFTQL